MTEEEKNKLLFEYSMKKCAECKALILLKEQIEKMKCCGNCSNYRCPDFQLDSGGCVHPESWELDK